MLSYQNKIRTNSLRVFFYLSVLWSKDNRVHIIMVIGLENKIGNMLINDFKIVMININQ